MKEKNYYDFSNYIVYPEKNNKNKLKIFIIIILIIIVIFLSFITIDIKENLEISDDMLQKSQNKNVEKTRLEEEKEKLEKEKEEEKRKREEKLPKLTEAGRENMNNIYHSETKRAFLTFDDGPSNVTPQILDILKSEDVKATFFMLGRNVEIFPETTKRVYNEGHYIANHGFSHVYSSIYSSPQTVLDEFNQCNEAVKKAIGEEQYNSHLFRFPGGLPGGKYAVLKLEAQNLLSENDILNIDWNSLTGDAETQNPVAENLLEKLKSTTEGKSSVVILMHDAQAKKITADILPQIIAYLREQGYEFKNFYEIIK